MLSAEWVGGAVLLSRKLHTLWRHSAGRIAAVLSEQEAILLLETSKIQQSDSSGVHIIRELGSQRDREGRASGCSDHAVHH